MLPIKAKRRIVTIHDVCHLALPNLLSRAQRIYAKVVLKAAVKLSDIILTDSTFSEFEIKERLKTKKSIHITSCAVSLQKVRLTNVIERLKLPSNYLLYVGNVKPHKNLKVILEALKDLPDENLIIVGKKKGFINSDREIDNLINRDSSIKKRIYFTEFVEDEDLFSLYANAKAFVFPSLYEGFGIPPLEAQLYNCPVISSNVASMPEVLKDSAMFFDPHNSLDLVDKITKLNLDTGLRNELIEKGFENVRRFTWEKTASQLINYIEAVK